jgi:hypothetical protein
MVEQQERKWFIVDDDTHMLFKLVQTILNNIINFKPESCQYFITSLHEFLRML